jgi:transaldolase
MVGRLDDWLKVAADKQDISVDPGVLEWAGVAVFKKTYGLFQERRYRLRLLSAAFRNHMHWSELIGGDVVISPPHAWQKRFNACDVGVESPIDKPIAPEILSALNKFADFRRASTEQGLSREEFDAFPPTRRTLSPVPAPRKSRFGSAKRFQKRPRLASGRTGPRPTRPLATARSRYPSLS